VLWFYEASAVLSRVQNNGTLAAAKPAQFIAELQSLNITADPDSPARVFTDVHRVALAYRLTSYDAAYLELAMRQSLPLATLDDDLIQASKAAGSGSMTAPPEPRSSLSPADAPPHGARRSRTCRIHRRSRTRPSVAKACITAPGKRPSPPEIRRAGSRSDGHRITVAPAAIPGPSAAADATLSTHTCRSRPEAASRPDTEAAGGIRSLYSP